MSRATDMAAGLRELADWLDENEGALPDSNLSELMVNVWCRDKDEFLTAARSLAGRREKIADDHYFTVRRSFGPVHVDVYTARSEVCRRVVVDRIERAEVVLPAHVEEVVEWVCDEPILAGVAA